MNRGVFAVLAASLGAALPARAATAPSFGVTAPYTKVGGSGATLYNPAPPRVAVSGADVWAAWGEATASGDDQIVVGHSADGGSTWDAGTILAHGTGVSPSPAIAVGTDPADAAAKIVHVVFGASDATGSGAVYYARLAGGAWTAPVAVSGSSPAIPDSAAVATDGVGGVHVAYTKIQPPGSTSAYAIGYSRSADGGATFFVVDGYVAGQAEAATRTSLAADATGAVYAAWNDGSGSPRGVWFSKRSSPRQFGFDPPALAASAWPVSAPSLARLDGSRLYVGYRWGMALGSFGMALAATADGGATWTTRNVSAGWGTPSVAVSSTGVISYAYDPAGVVLTRSSNAGATWSSAVTVDAGGQVPSLALDGSSKALFVYHRFSGSAVYFTREK